MPELGGEDAYDPHPGVACCPCVERLRAQNKASSDEWTQRTATMQSDRDELRALMREAGEMNRTDAAIGRLGMSVYGQAALATALMEADEARLELTALRAQMFKERRGRLYAEAQMLTERRKVEELRKEKADA